MSAPPPNYPPPPGQPFYPPPHMPPGVLSRATCASLPLLLTSFARLAAGFMGAPGMPPRPYGAMPPPGPWPGSLPPGFSQAPPPPNTSVYVGKISPLVDDDLMRVVLETCGELRRCEPGEGPSHWQAAGHQTLRALARVLLLLTAAVPAAGSAQQIRRQGHRSASASPTSPPPTACCGRCESCASFPSPAPSCC